MEREEKKKNNEGGHYVWGTGNHGCLVRMDGTKRMTHEQLRLLPYDEECILRDCHELSPIIKPVLAELNMVKVYGGNYYFFGIDKDEVIWYWGVGVGSTPVIVKSLLGLQCVEFACGLHTSAMLDTKGRIYIDVHTSSHPQLNFKQVDIDIWPIHICCVLTTFYAVSNNTSGCVRELVNKGSIYTTVTAKHFPEKVKHIAGGYGLFVLFESGKVFNSERESKDKLEYVPELKDIVQIDSIRGNRIALDKNGRVFVWGPYNHFDDLADGPLDITKHIQGRVIRVFAVIGDYSYSVLTEEGDVWSWGDHGHWGRLGIGKRSGPSVVGVVKVPGLPPVDHLILAFGSSLVFTKDTPREESKRILPPLSRLCLEVIVSKSVNGLTKEIVNSLPDEFARLLFLGFIIHTQTISDQVSYSVITLFWDVPLTILPLTMCNNTKTNDKQEGEEEEDVVEVYKSKLRRMTRSEVQQLAKEAGFKANVKADKLIKQLSVMMKQKHPRKEAPKSPGEEVIVTILENPKWQESVEMITLPPLGKNSYKIYLQQITSFKKLKQLVLLKPDYGLRKRYEKYVKQHLDHKRFGLDMEVIHYVIGPVKQIVQ